MALQNRRRNVIFLSGLAALIVIAVLSYRSFNGTQPSEKPLSDLLTALDNRQVASGTFTNNGDRIDWVDAQGRHYRTFLTSSYADVLVDRFHQQHLPIVVTPSSADNLLLTVILPNLILFTIIGGFMWYMLRRTRGWGWGRPAN